MRTVILLLASNIMLFLYSCTNESITQSINNNRVIGHLDNNNTRTIFISNGNITDTHWVENDSIGLFNSIQQNVIYTAINGGKSTEFKANATELSFKDGNKITAYYPYTDSIKDNKIKLPNTTKMKSTDSPISFMYSNSTVSNNELNLYFNHLYAYLQIKLSTNNFTDKFSQLSSGSYKKEGVSIYITSSEYISTSDAWFNIETNEISYNEKGGSKHLFYVCDDIDFSTSDTLIYMIPILPQVEGTVVNVNIAVPAYIEGYIYNFSLTSKKIPAEGLQAGHVYTINTVDNIKPSEEQYKLLEELYNSTNGNLWRNNNNWLTDKPLKEWYGLNEGDVNHSYVNNIELNNNILTGTLPESFTNLMDCVRQINLSFNGMSGEIPDAIKKHERWEEIGWNIVTQDTRLSDGFNLIESNLYLSHFTMTNILDSNELDIESILSKNKLTQVIFHCQSDTIKIKEMFSESHVNLHLDYNEKGLGTVLVMSYGLNISDEFIKKNYGDIKGLDWTISLTLPNHPMSCGMSYIFNTNGELVYFAPYYFDSYIYHEYLKDNDIVHQKYSSFLKSVLGEPNKHEEFKFVD